MTLIVQNALDPTLLIPVANGGTGTTTPGLVQGSNITITGTWPNQTIAGPTSTQGSTGPTGPTGAASTVVGPQGIQGIVGPTGLQGIQGIVGPTGIQGVQGIQGPVGPTGPQGIQGPTGDQGVVGPTGNQGIQGVQGPTGAASTVAGPTGAASTVAGPTGAASTVAGPTGAASTVAGPTGLQGPTGPTGTTPDINNFVTLTGSQSVSNKTIKTFKENVSYNDDPFGWSTSGINFDVLTAPVKIFGNQATSNFIVNIRGNATTSLSSVLANGESITANFFVRNLYGTTYYPTTFKIDGVTVTPQFQGGAPIVSGNSTDLYVIFIVKIPGDWWVYVSQTKFG